MGLKPLKERRKGARKGRPADEWSAALCYFWPVRMSTAAEKLPFTLESAAAMLAAPNPICARLSAALVATSVADEAGAGATNPSSVPILGRLRAGGGGDGPAGSARC